jgi:hypothetical protein
LREALAHPVGELRDASLVLALGAETFFIVYPGLR